MEVGRHSLIGVLLGQFPQQPVQGLEGSLEVAPTMVPPGFLQSLPDALLPGGQVAGPVALALQFGVVLEDAGVAGLVEGLGVGVEGFFVGSHPETLIPLLDPLPDLSVGLLKTFQAGQAALSLGVMGLEVQGLPVEPTGLLPGAVLQGLLGLPEDLGQISVAHIASNRFVIIIRARAAYSHTVRQLHS